MKKRFYIPLIAIIIGIIILFVVFASRTNKPSYLNIKSIPENTPNYLLVHNDLIVEGFSRYFLKHPLELTKFYKFFKKFKLINSSVDYGIILNEPTAIYYDNNTQSLNGIVKVKDSDYSTVIPYFSEDYLQPVVSIGLPYPSHRFFTIHVWSIIMVIVFKSYCRLKGSICIGLI